MRKPRAQGAGLCVMDQEAMHVKIQPHMPKASQFVRALALLAMVLAALGQATPAHAAGIVVNDAGDDLHSPGCATTGTGDCTLRDAITYANSNAAADTITFDGNYTIHPTISELPSAATDVTIDGSGHHIVIDPNYGHQGFYVDSAGALSLTHLTIQNGVSSVGAGVGVNTGGTLALTDVTMRWNSATSGGAIWSTGGTVTISRSTFIENTAVNGGGAITNDGGTLDVTRSTFSGNAVVNCQSATSGTVAVSQGSAEVTGTGTSFTSDLVDGGWVVFGAPNDVPYKVASVSNDTQFTLSRKYIGTSNAAISMYRCYANGDGGAIWNQGGGTATVTDSTFSNNSAVSGGAIYNYTNSISIITGSTFDGNIAVYSSGGAIYDSNGTVYVTNSTLHDNSAFVGGGIFENNGTTTVTNSTLSGNSASNVGGGVLVQGTASSTIAFTNTIVANSTGGNCLAQFDATISDGGNNLEWGSGAPSNTCGFSTTSADPQLGPLQNNGGPTQTMALQIGSPAIDAGNDTVCNDSANPWSVNGVDQRGLTRPIGAHCDIGAFEAPASAAAANAKGGAGGAAKTLPTSGFAPGVRTILPIQPRSKSYSSTALVLEIPSLQVKTSIVGVARSGASWDVTWLGAQAGWLSGSAYPTWAGNSVLTGHVWNADNSRGIFGNLKQLRYGDQIKIGAYGQTYTYEVRENRLVWPSQIGVVFQHEDLDWVTLLTCEDYKGQSADYTFRRMVRAVLVGVQ
jgi:LPXTG-site transpeptidase (sortase) family protein